MPQHVIGSHGLARRIPGLGRNRCGASRLAGVIAAGLVFESGHEFAVGGAGGGQVFLAFVELLLTVEVVLWCAA